MIDKKWLPDPPLAGKVRVWEFAAEPKAQLPPKHLYAKPLPKGSPRTSSSSTNPRSSCLLRSEGAIDFRYVKDGNIQARIILGKSAVGKTKLSSDRNWLAMEQDPATKNSNIGVPTETFEVGVYESTTVHKAMIRSCSRLLDVGSGGKVVAVVRKKKIELWYVATSKLSKFGPVRVHANRRGQLLARRQVARRLRPERTGPLAMGGQLA